MAVALLYIFCLTWMNVFIGTNGIVNCGLVDICKVNCTLSSDCYNTIIDASEANSLILHCSGVQGACGGSQIICPQNSASSCSINCIGHSVCQNVVINTTYNTMIDLINIKCIGYHSCYSSSIFLYADPISSSITELNSFSMLCDSAESCARSVLNTTNIPINDFKLICSASNETEVHMCHWMEVYAMIINNINIGCKGDTACIGAVFQLKLIGNDSSVDINCSNPFMSPLGRSIGSVSNGACVSANIVIKSEFIENNNQLSMICGQHDCVYIDVDFLYLSNVSVGCDALYSCDVSLFRVSTSSYFKLHCGHALSCPNSNIYCPQQMESSCHIEIEATNNDILDTNVSIQSYPIRVYSDDYYSFNYLDVECKLQDGLSENEQFCSGIYVQCIDSDKSDTYLDYSFDDEMYECYIEESGYCCPYQILSTTKDSTGNGSMLKYSSVMWIWLIV